MRARGIDISKYDLLYEPEKATEPLEFVIQRASWQMTRDERFELLVPGVMRTPIRLAYHYLSSYTPWKEQADFFLNVVQGYDYHGFVCDFEKAFNVLSQGFAKSAWEWIQYVEARTGKQTFLYTNYDHYNNYIAPSEVTYGIDWDTVPYWQAQWFYIINPEGTPTMPTKRTAGWNLWQYTNIGKGFKYGLGRENVADLDVFNGTVEDMRTFLRIGQAPVVAPKANITIEFNGTLYEANEIQLTKKI